jgi:epsilon-lactone hydrolase
MPLAPEHTYRDTYPLLLALYQHLCDTLHPENLTIMGDSAGGGMALSLVQQAVAQGLPHPKQTFLTSPWLDLTLRNPAIASRDRSDPVLISAGMRVLARWWAGGDDPTSPVLSPINGSLAGIGPCSWPSGLMSLSIPMPSFSGNEHWPKASIWNSWRKRAWPICFSLHQSPKPNPCLIATLSVSSTRLVCSS